MKNHPKCPNLVHFSFSKDPPFPAFPVASLPLLLPILPAAPDLSSAEQSCLAFAECRLRVNLEQALMGDGALCSGCETWTPPPDVSTQPQSVSSWTCMLTFSSFNSPTLPRRVDVLDLDCLLTCYSMDCIVECSVPCSEQYTSVNICTAHIHTCRHIPRMAWAHFLGKQMTNFVCLCSFAYTRQKKTPCWNVK